MIIRNLLKIALEEATAKERFDMRALSLEAISTLKDSSVSKQHLNIATYLGERVSSYILDSLLRASFLTEIVKTPKIETTKMEVHWADRLGANDPRYASYEECLRIFEKGMTAVENSLNNAEHCKLLSVLASKHHLPYELPLDYNRRETIGHIHHPSNMLWLWDDEGTKRAIQLRAYLTNKINNPAYASVFAKAYIDKIKVKTYLTDRVLTGKHKTNREKRWEVHPASVHFAFRRSCMEIEHQLVTQLCSFEGFPSELKQDLDQAKLLGSCEVPYRCPITLDPLHFDKFVAEIQQPTHGKSDFQVGHLNPLKAINDDPESGHTSRNIGWISSNGNRIQGSLTLEHTRKLIGRIVRNYDLLGVPLEPGTEEETRNPEEENDVDRENV
jgi:hypothetical protein